MKKILMTLVVFLVLVGIVREAGRFFPDNPFSESRKPDKDHKPQSPGQESYSWPMLFPLADGYSLPAVGSYALPFLEQAPDALLLDPQGDIRDLYSVLDGQVSLVSFVYLLCGDANGCPLAISTLYELYHTSAEIPALSDHLQLITVSFDPGRDTPEMLQSFFYPLSSDPRRDDKISWSVFTSPSEEAMRSLTDGFGQVVDRRPGSPVIQHLLRMYLIDRQGRVRNIYGLGMIDPALIMSDVVTLITEDQEVTEEDPPSDLVQSAFRSAID